MKSFTEALRDRYGDVGDIGDNNINFVMMGKPSKSRKRGGSESKEDNVEFAHLKTVALDNQEVGCAGLPKNGLESLCPNVNCLDLQKNCLTSWTDILTIMSNLPHLKYFNLSFNKIQTDQESLGNWTKPMQCLEDLVLNFTGVSWDEVVSLVRLSPKLKELHLSENGYETVPDKDLHEFHQIETLHLNDNNIRDWSEFWKLRYLPQLQYLFVSGNPVEALFYDQSGHRDVEDAQTFSPSAAEDPVAMCGAILDDIVSNLKNPEGQTPDIDVAVKTDSYSETICSAANASCDNEAQESKLIASQILDGVLDGVTRKLKCSEEDKQTVLNSGKNTCEQFSLKTQKESSNYSVNTDDMPSENKVLVPSNCDNNEQSSTKCNLSNLKAMPESVSNSKDLQPFPKLCKLWLSQTKLSDWRDLEAVNSFPNLKSVKVTGISLAGNMSNDDKRKLFVACLPSINVLNGAEISHVEREKAERYFLRHFYAEEIKPERYEELVQKHGMLEPLAEIDITRGFQEWVTVKFVYNGREVLEDKIRLMDNVKQLKTFIRKNLCRELRITRFKIWHLACGPFHFDPEPLELAELFLDNLPLSRFDIQEGDEIHIEKIDFSQVNIRFYAKDKDPKELVVRS